MTEPDLAQLLVDQFAAIKHHMGSHWPEPGFEVDISVTATGRIHYGVGPHVYYLLDGMCARSQRSEKRSVVMLFANGEPVATRIVTTEGRFISSHEGAANN